MFPASTKQGSAVSGFPDVCKTPSWPQPLPLPYPGVNYDWRTSQKAPPDSAGKKVLVKRASFSMSTGDEAGTVKGVATNKQLGDVNFKIVESSLRSNLARLHNDMMVMQSNDPERWHAALDNYVRLVAELYKARVSS